MMREAKRGRARIGGEIANICSQSVRSKPQSGLIGLCVYDIKLISAPARWSPIGRCRGDYAPTVAAGDCIGEEVVVEVGERSVSQKGGAGGSQAPAKRHRWCDPSAW